MKYLSRDSVKLLTMASIAVTSAMVTPITFKPLILATTAFTASYVHAVWQYRRQYANNKFSDTFFKQIKASLLGLYGLSFIACIFTKQINTPLHKEFFCAPDPIKNIAARAMSACAVDLAAYAAYYLVNNQHHFSVINIDKGILNNIKEAAPKQMLKDVESLIETFSKAADFMNRNPFIETILSNGLFAYENPAANIIKLCEVSFDCSIQKLFDGLSKSR